jgi:hypothetical protein
VGEERGEWIEEEGRGGGGERGERGRERRGGGGFLYYTWKAGWRNFV